ncbi:MAG: hypothetical protein JKY88_08680 [Pseudomonadales bacterium]|nr:hypothetical protein [Pseudomonadales bacterium]
MNEAYPDLEIYIKRVEPKLILKWLTDRLLDDGTTIEKTEVKSNTLLCTFKKNGRKLSCAIVDKAVKGGYVSVWFKENRTPWKTDRDFALAAFEFFKLEVRCSTGPWEDHLNEGLHESSDESVNDSSDEGAHEDSDKGGWIRFTIEGEKIVNWLT